ncbi:MAG: PadR family transcriptional regulator [Chloroflexales bacterium]|nr:PadR family transcriptional regulator [Chloroflexales bacterium]
MSTIRMLLLGIIRSYQPIHGYEIRRQLELWGAAEWANIAYGSIYSALNKMADEDLVDAVATTQHGRGPARTEYSITERGEQHFQVLLRKAWWEYKPIIDPFQVALALMDEMPRDELLAALRARAIRLRAHLEIFSYAQSTKLAGGAPRHIAENLRLVAAHGETELRWIEEVLGKVERGELP